MRHDLACGSAIFQPSNVLPSKIWMKPSSESAAERAVAVASARSEPIRNVFIGGQSKPWFSVSSQLFCRNLLRAHLDTSTNSKVVRALRSVPNSEQIVLFSEDR